MITDIYARDVVSALVGGTAVLLVQAAFWGLRCLLRRRARRVEVDKALEELHATRIKARPLN